MINLKPRVIKLGIEQRELYEGDTLDLTISTFAYKYLIKLKIIIKKDTYLKDTVLIIENPDKSFKETIASIALLGYENCYQYQRKKINLIVCIEKM